MNRINNQNVVIRKKENKREKRKNPIKSFFIKLIIVIILIISILGYWFYKKVEENGGGIKGTLITVLGLTVEKVDDIETINVVLLGISEDLENKLTDTIIVCSYNPKTQKTTMISIPRDTFVGKNKNKARGTDKINSLYAKSPEKLLKALSEITEMDLKYYAVINNNAVIEIVDIIGGVNFDVPIDMDYDDPTQDLHIHLKSGMQKIDGQEAEQLLRFRHNNDGSSYPIEYGDNDYGRMKTQREFISETIRQTLSIKNILNSKKIYDTIWANIETNLDDEIIKLYIPDAVYFDTSSIVSEQLPGKSAKLNELWFFEYNPKETKQILEELNEYINN